MLKFRFIQIVLIFILSGNLLSAQNLVIDLYPEGQIPNFTPTDEREVRDTTDVVRIGTVQTPDISIFFPAKKSATGEAVIICPGGGYRILAYDFEGEDIAKFWNSKGVVGIVLKYRLPTSISQIEPHKSPLLDAQRAMRLVRFNAEKWNIDPEKIGIMGFSAGGHLASTLSTHFDAGDPNSKDPIERMSCRPDFSILLYPVISFTGNFKHTGSKNNLIANNEELAKYYSNELQVTSSTPPTILIHAADDTSVPVENSIVYFQALVKNNVPAEMHIFPEGKHGFSLAIGKGHLDSWPELTFKWLKYLEN